MKLEISVPEMRRIIGATIRTISKDESREAINSLSLTLEGDTLIAASTDGHRLAKYTRKLEAPMDGETRESGTCLISRYTIEEVQRQIKKMAVGVVRIDTTTREIFIAPTNVRYLYPDRSECKFPPIDNVIPQMCDQREGLRWMCLKPKYLAEAAAAFSDVLELKKTEDPAVCIQLGCGELDPMLLTVPDAADDLVIVLMPMRTREPGYPAVKPTPKKERSRFGLASNG